MKKIIEGLAYVLGNDVDTDQIIPAEHLVYSLSDPEEKKNYGKFALSGVPGDQAGLPNGNVPFTEGENFESKYSIVVGGKNFGWLRYLRGKANLYPPSNRPGRFRPLAALLRQAAEICGRLPRCLKN